MRLKSELDVAGGWKIRQTMCGSLGSRMEGPHLMKDTIVDLEPAQEINIGVYWEYQKTKYWTGI